MDRRTLVATLFGFPLGASATARARNETHRGRTVDCNETVEVVTRRGTKSNPTEPTHTAEWPKPWRDQWERASEVKSAVHREYENEPWFIHTGITLSGGTELCGRSEPSVRVGVHDVEAAREQLEDERDGVNVVVEESEPARALGGSTNDDAGVAQLSLLGGALAGLAGVGYVVSRGRKTE